MISFDEFVKKLCYFGGNLTSDVDDVGKTYEDLEVFVVDATRFMSEDPRVTQCFLAWLTKYGIILSPSKLRRVLKKYGVYDSAIFGVFLEILKSNNRQHKHWDILKVFVRKDKQRLLFLSLPAPPKKKENILFKKYGLLAYEFHLNEQKYLLPSGAILKSCPEIRYRALGLGIPASDLRAFQEKNPHVTSLYEIAKQTHHPRTSIYLCMRLFEDLGTIERAA